MEFVRGCLRRRKILGRLTIETCPKRRDILEPVRVQLGENRLDSGWVLAAQLISPEELEKNENVHKKSANELLDYDKIKGENVPAAPGSRGDRMQLPGRGFTSAVKKLIRRICRRSAAVQRIFWQTARAWSVSGVWAVRRESARTKRHAGCWCWNGLKQHRDRNGETAGLRLFFNRME